MPLKNLARRKLRNGLTALGIALATATYLAMNAIFGGLTANWQTSLDQGDVHAVILEDRQIDWLASTVPTELAQELAGRQDVADASPELISFLSTSDGVPLLVTGWPRTSSAWRQLGENGLPPPLPGRGYLGFGVAKGLGLSVGDRLSLDGLDVDVAAILPPTDPISDGRVIIDIKVLQDAMFRDSTATLIRVQFTDPSDADVIANLSGALAAIAPGLAIRPTADLSRDNRILQVLEVLHHAVVWTIALAAAAGVANTMLMAITERRGEIGLYRALGWRPKQILALFLAEAGFISLLGGLVGIALGALVVVIVRSNPSLASLLAAGLDIELAVLSVGLAVTLGLVGAAAPAIHAMRIPMDTALRSW